MPGARVSGGAAAEVLALFGSVPRGTAGPLSDIDILVEFKQGEKSFDRFIELGDLLERVLGRRVELVTPEALSPLHCVPAAFLPSQSPTSGD